MRWNLAAATAFVLVLAAACGAEEVTRLSTTVELREDAPVGTVLPSLVELGLGPKVHIRHITEGNESGLFALYSTARALMVARPNLLDGRARPTVELELDLVDETGGDDGGRYLLTIRVSPVPI
jgi:hypothetical protein